MTTATKTKPQDAVAAAEATLAALEQKREKLVAARARDDEQMKAVSYQAHALHEAGASSTLSEISARAIERDQRIRSIDCAIAEARQRLAAAERAEAKEAERAAAVQVLAVVERLRLVAQAADDALSALVEAGGEMHAGVDELHGSGARHQPGNSSSFGERAIRSAVQQTIWSRCIERVSPSESTSFVRVFDQWATAIERRVGETERSNTEAA